MSIIHNFQQKHQAIKRCICCMADCTEFLYKNLYLISVCQLCLFTTCFVSFASTKISIYIHNFRLKHEAIKRYCRWLPPTISGFFPLSFCWRCPFLISISVKQDNFGVFVSLPSYGEVFSLDQRSLCSGTAGDEKKNKSGLCIIDLNNCAQKSQLSFWNISPIITTAEFRWKNPDQRQHL